MGMQKLLLPRDYEEREADKVSGNLQDALHAFQVSL